MWNLPPGFRSAMCGTRAATRLKSSSESSTPASLAIASRCSTALVEPPTADVSVQWVAEGWPEDIARSLDGFRANEGDRHVQYVVADVTETDPARYGDGVEVLRLEPGTGWGAARNAVTHDRD